jgi:NADH:ubiquinone oxidoreductase subunit 5 (subunit L)/multisubunit Na+/H+ antiporter MnhA subunit
MVSLQVLPLIMFSTYHPSKTWKAGLFHLITHAYSKDLLLLGSGFIIHSMEPIVGYSPGKSQKYGFDGWFEKKYIIPILLTPLRTIVEKHTIKDI